LEEKSQLVEIWLDWRLCN